jgi:hypothetical protein
MAISVSMLLVRRSRAPGECNAPPMKQDGEVA